MPLVRMPLPLHSLLLLNIVLRNNYTPVRMDLSPVSDCLGDAKLETKAGLPLAVTQLLCFTALYGSAHSKVICGARTRHLNFLKNVWGPTPPSHKKSICCMLLDAEL